MPEKKKPTPRTKKPPVRTQKKASIPKIPKTPKKTSSKAKPSTEAVGDAWGDQQKRQESVERVLSFPKVIIFGKKTTGKTHVLQSACKQTKTEVGNFIFNDFFPIRIIDCGNAAHTIAMKDFPDEFRRGNIVIIRATIHWKTGDILTDPTAIIENVRALITQAQRFRTGSIGIDEFDKIENWCRTYIYREYNMYRKSNGELWYRVKTKYVNGRPVTVPEHQVVRIMPFMYGPRNNQIRDIMEMLSQMVIPVVIVAHEEDEYNRATGEPTGKIISNLKEFVEDDANVMVRFMNITSSKLKKDSKKASIQLVDSRRMICTKNNYQGGKAPENKVVEQDSFEFSDIFSLITQGVKHNGKKATSKKENNKKSTSKKATSKKEVGKKSTSKKEDLKGKADKK